jgi:hypothetical protein
MSPIQEVCAVINDWMRKEMPLGLAEREREDVSINILRINALILLKEKLVQKVL